MWNPDNCLTETEWTGGLQGWGRGGREMVQMPTCRGEALGRCRAEWPRQLTMLWDIRKSLGEQVFKVLTS